MNIQDTRKHLIYRKESKNETPLVHTPSRFRRKKQFHGDTASIYNNNFRDMPKDF